MQEYEYKKSNNTYILRLNKGAEIISAIKNFCNEQEIKLATVQGIGAINQVTFGFFNPEIGEYQEKTFTGPMEITSLLGNVTTKEEKTYLHLHMTTSGSDYKTYGGHLVNAKISLTGEIFITKIEGQVERQYDENTGLNLLSFK